MRYPLIGALALCTLACNTYSTTTAVSGQPGWKYVTFDDRLPDALETLFDECHEPLVLDDTTTSLDLAGTCDDSGDLPDVESQVLWAAIMTSGSRIVDLDGLLSEDIALALDDVYHIEGFAWPIQNCDVWLDLSLEFNGITIDDVTADWLPHSSAPSLKVQLVASGDDPLAAGDIEGDVACPNPFNEIFIKPHLPNGPHELSLGARVDAYFGFSIGPNGQSVVVTPDVVVDFDELVLDPPLDDKVTDAAGDLEQILEDHSDFDLETMRLGVGDTIEDGLDGIADALGDSLFSAVPSGHRLCEINIVSGKLRLKTSPSVCVTRG